MCVFVAALSFVMSLLSGALFGKRLQTTELTEDEPNDVQSTSYAVHSDLLGGQHFLFTLCSMALKQTAATAL